MLKLNHKLNKPSRQYQTGFTIVELLIVVVIIAILAAITIVAYGGIQNRANDSAIRSDLSNMAKLMEVMRVDTDRYPQVNADFVAYSISRNSYDTVQNNFYYLLDTVAQNYAIGIRSKSNKGFILTKGGIQEVPAVNASITASAIGKAPFDSGVVIIQGYDTSKTPKWNQNWVWSKE